MPQFQKWIFSGDLVLVSSLNSLSQKLPKAGPAWCKGEKYFSISHAQKENFPPLGAFLSAPIRDWKYLTNHEIGDSHSAIGDFSLKLTYLLPAPFKLQILSQQPGLSEYQERIRWCQIYTMYIYFTIMNFIALLILLRKIRLILPARGVP